VCAAKLLQDVLPTLGAWRKGIIHESLSELVSILRGVSTEMRFSNRQDEGRKNHGKKETDLEMKF
jgi:hypothetical protein